MKRIRWILIPSGACLLLLAAEPAPIKLLIALLLGALLGLALYRRPCPAAAELSAGAKVLGILPGAALSFGLSLVFYEGWLPLSWVQSLLGARAAFLFRAVSLAAALFAMPALSALGLRLMTLFSAVLSRFSWRDFAAELKGGLRPSRLLGSLLRLLLAAGAGLALLLGVFALPRDSVRRHVAESAEILAEEGTRPVLYAFCSSMLDNFTDSLMLLEAADEGEGSLLTRALLVCHGSMEGAEPDQVLVRHFREGEAYSESVSYARYWHGYLVPVTLLLLFTDYGGIRLLNGLLQLLLAAGIAFLLYRKQLARLIPGWLLAWGMAMPLALAKSLQLSACWYLLCAGLLALLLTAPERLCERYGRIFLWLGFGTAYFDYLTYPLAVAAVPVLLLLCLPASGGAERRLAMALRSGFSWALGYGGLWSFKWLLATLFTGQNVFADALASAAERTGLETGQQLSAAASLANSLLLNLRGYLFTPVTLALVLYLAYRLGKARPAVRPQEVLPFVLVGLLPLIWYAALTNHSSLHYFFTQKGCVVSLLALLWAG